MARRRVLSFSAYTRRKWRVVGLTVVLMVATLMLFALTDRGHEPAWRDRAGNIEQVKASPDGRVLLAVMRDEESVNALTAFDVETGDELWTREVNFTPSLGVTAGDGWFAVASRLPRAQLAAFDAQTGEDVFTEYLGADPRAVSADGRVLAVALQSGSVLVFEDFEPVVTHRAPGLVSAMHASGGRVALGTTDGYLVVYERSREVLNVTMDVRVQSLRLARDGGHLFAGGGVTDGGFGGGVAYYNLFQADAARPVWERETGARVGFVDMDASGRYLIAVEETHPRFTVHHWDAIHPSPAWSRQVEGAVFRMDGGLAGGIGISPDGRLVAYAATIGGGVTAVDAFENEVLWTYDAEGTTSVSFAGNVADGRFGANARLVPARPYTDHVLAFDSAWEPVASRFPAFALGVLVVEGLGGVAILGAGYWWYRRS